MSNPDPLEVLVVEDDIGVVDTLVELLRIRDSGRRVRGSRRRSTAFDEDDRTSW